MVMIVNESNFSQETSKGLVIVDFYADWCGPCRAYNPILEALTDVKVVKVNIDKDSDLAIKYQVSAIPKLVFLKDGEVVSEYTGIRSEKELQEKINSLNQPNMMYIGVGGQAQMGKDSIADRLFEKLTEKTNVVWNRSAFANNVKRVFEESFGVNREFTEQWKVISDNAPGFDMSVRKALQFIGDGFRQIQGSIWLDLTFRDNENKIISDVRYPNEWKRIRLEKGMNILVGRPDRLSDDPNGSEALIKPYCEWALNNLTEDKFYDLSQVDLTGAPEGMNEFNIFVRNDTSVEDLYDVVDTKVVDYVENFIRNKNNDR